MWTDNASKIDMLFYKPYAEIVSDIAIETDIDPLTIGILGLWGAGKSTLLNLIEQHYKEKDGIIYLTYGWNKKSNSELLCLFNKERNREWSKKYGSI